MGKTEFPPDISLKHLTFIGVQPFPCKSVMVQLEKVEVHELCIEGLAKGQGQRTEHTCLRIRMKTKNFNVYGQHGTRTRELDDTYSGPETL